MSNRGQCPDRGSQLKRLITVDGSQGEGGGQMIRNAVSYATILGRNILLKNIRAGRPKPGLASQHLQSIKALLRISNSSTSCMLKLGLTEFEYMTESLPDQRDGVDLQIDLITAGSVTLCCQCIIPYLLRLRSPSSIGIIGGTHVMQSPSFDYFERVFLPVINKILKYEVSCKLVRPGYFPRGGGCIQLFVNNSSSFHPVNVTNRGLLVRTHVILNLTTELYKSRNDLEASVFQDNISIECRITPFASVEYFLEFESSYAGFNRLLVGRNPKLDQMYDAISETQREMDNFLKSDACVDRFMQDQLIMYMTLAKLHNEASENRLISVSITNHTKSAIHVSQMFSSSSFQVKEDEEKRTCSIFL